MTAWICLLATIEGTIAALIMERGNPAVWAIKWNTTLLETLYSVTNSYYIFLENDLDGLCCN
ncbi:hypothetical protein Hdeb2414_s0220g00837721 [Helianthus debilis subsp. tardiflorus]